MSVKTPNGNVERLDNFRDMSAIQERQDRIRGMVSDFAARPDSEAAVAVAGVAILASGEITTTAMNIEPEHVVPLVSALNKLTGELMRFLGRS